MVYLNINYFNFQLQLASIKNQIIMKMRTENPIRQKGNER